MRQLACIVDSERSMQKLGLVSVFMLVAAFGGYELMMRAYREAVGRGYRFYSYGDAMAIL